MSRIPQSPQRPFMTLSVIIWLGVCGSIVIGLAVAQTFVIMGGMIIIMGIGVIPTRERPLFSHVIQSIKFKWRRWRRGTIVRRKLSSTTFKLRKGVNRLNGLFNVEVASIIFRESSSHVVRIPVLFNDRKHTITLESGTNPDAAMADAAERSFIRENEASLFVDLAETLGVGNSFTLWSLTRPTDVTLDVLYANERFEPDIMKGTTEADRKKRENFDDDLGEISEGHWSRRRGIALTATTPSSWKPRKLDKLTQPQLNQSRAVKAARIAETKMDAIGIDKPRVCSVPAYNLLLSDIMSLKGGELRRERAVTDTVNEVAANKQGSFVDEAELDSTDDSPFPQMQRELGNDYMIFDGTYHRVLWVTEFLTPDGYDDLYTAECNYFVGVYVDVQLATKDDSKRQDKRKLADQALRLFKRNLTAQDEEYLQNLESERFDALAYGRHVAYFRTLVIVSGVSYEDMEESQQILEDHLARHNLRLQLNAVTGDDQLEWFFAALGSFGKGKV